MTTTRRETIRRKALELVATRPTGIRFSELARMIQESFPDIPLNTVISNMWNLDAVFPDTVYKPARGVFKAIKFRDAEAQQEASALEEAPRPSPGAPAEEDFYEPFADWITNELEECTKAVQLGGNRFKDKWGTPDVVGIREPKKSDIVKPPTEIVSAEIKADRANLIVAFGQACAYKLYSHRSY
ncbi:MAG: hypothetical protein HY510_03240, partial [Acidobacteria bacterium]|nr:hypothetical protein [Acidobacteriota bacterium]